MKLKECPKKNNYSYNIQVVRFGKGEKIYLILILRVHLLMQFIREVLEM